VLTLLKSEKFQNEYKKFQENISSITNESTKKELEDLLKKLVVEVQNIDRQHSEISAAKQLSISATDSRNSIAEIRKKLDQKLSDWAAAQQR
jgi:flagellar biosynthesis chaperone FliJ